MSKTAAETLEYMADTFRKRNKVYGDNYLRFGNSMHSLFPNGLTIDTPEGWTRLYFFMLTQVKSSRYATNFAKGGHPDSIHDAAIYAAMLETFDEHVAAKEIVAAASHGKVDRCDGNEAQNAPHRAPTNVGKRNATRR